MEKSEPEEDLAVQVKSGVDLPGGAGSQIDPPAEVEIQEEHISDTDSGSDDAGTDRPFLRYTLRRMILQGESADAILETIKNFDMADRKSRRYLRKNASHFVGYVGSRSGSADAGENTDSVLEAIGTNADVPASSDESMTSADFRKFSTEYEEECNSKAVEEGEAMDE